MRPFALTFAIASLLAVALSSPAEAITTSRFASDLGWYNDAGNHVPENTNYIAGWDPGGPVEWRNFFVFDLSGITGTVTSATLDIVHTNYNSDDQTETFTLFEVSTDVDILVDGLGGVPAFQDMGTGTTYGAFVTSAADVGTVISISLNADALNAMELASGWFAIGGAVTTLRRDPGIFMDEKIFGGSGDPFGGGAELIFEVIPEPSTALLLGLGLIGIAANRRRVARG